MKRVGMWGLPVLALGLLTSPILGNLVSQTWYLNQSNTFPDDVNYGSVTITADNDTGKIDFKINLFDNPSYTASGNNFGVQEFGFNFANVNAPSTWTNLVLPAGWSQDNTTSTLNGFGKFDIREDGAGGSRQPALEFSFVLPDTSQALVDNFAQLSTGDADEGNIFFAAHVAGFDNPQASSHIIGGSTPVPAPSGAIILFIGLGTIGWIKRRFQ